MLANFSCTCVGFLGSMATDRVDSIESCFAQGAKVRTATTDNHHTCMHFSGDIVVNYSYVNEPYLGYNN